MCVNLSTTSLDQLAAGCRPRKTGGGIQTTAASSYQPLPWDWDEHEPAMNFHVVTNQAHAMAYCYQLWNRENGVSALVPTIRSMLATLHYRNQAQHRRSRHGTRPVWRMRSTCRASRDACRPRRASALACFPSTLWLSADSLFARSCFARVFICSARA